MLSAFFIHQLSNLYILGFRSILILIDMFNWEDEAVREMFYNDVVNSVVFKTPIAYIQKYPSIDDYSKIVETQNRVLVLLRGVLEKELEKASKISEWIGEQGIETSIATILGKIMVNKLNDIRQVLMRHEITQGAPCLVDINWRVVNITSTSWSAKTGKVILGLSLFMEEKQISNSGKTIELQLNMHEAESLLARLKEIKKSLKQ